MKLYINLARAVVQALQMIFEDGRYADKVIEKVLKQNPKWGARDRKFIAETTYDIVRWYRLVQNITEAEDGDFWKLLGGWCIVHNIPLPAWEEFAGLNPARVTQRLDKMNNIRRFRESIPDWLDELGERELPERWDEELHALNGDASVVLRANSLKTTRDVLRERLAADGIETKNVPEVEDGLELRRQHARGLAVDGVRRRVARLAHDLLALDHLHEPRVPRVRLGVDDVDARRVRARHHEITPLHMRIRCPGAQV